MRLAHDPSRAIAQARPAGPAALGRRRFLGAAVGLLGAPVAARAQTGRAVRIAVLSSAGPEQESAIWAPLREHLRARGWAEGRNLSIEWRYAQGNYDRMAGLAAELVQGKPDLLMARGGPGSMAAKEATSTIPIVVYNVTDPVGIGLVPSLARPGGNVTGLSDDQGPAILAKRWQLLKSAAPALARIAVLTRVPASASVPLIQSYEQALERDGRALGLEVRVWRVRDAGDIDRAFPAIAADGAVGLDVHYVPVTWAHRQQIMALAARHRLPAIYWHRRYVLDGGLMAYGEDEREAPRRLAEYVDRILRGARPADLPIEQPSKFDLLVNLRAARALGLAIPPAVLLQADQVVD